MEEEIKRVALYVDETRAADLHNLCIDYCDAINTFTLPLLEQYGIELTDIEIIDATLNCESLLDIILTYETKRNKGGKYIVNIIEQEVTKAYKQALKNLPPNVNKRYNGGLDIDSQCKPFIVKADNCSTFAPDMAKIREYCTKYVEGKELELWNKLQQATEILNDVFCGRCPVVFQSMWDNKDGYLELNPKTKLYLFI